MMEGDSVRKGSDSVIMVRSFPSFTSYSASGSFVMSFGARKVKNDA